MRREHYHLEHCEAPGCGVWLDGVIHRKTLLDGVVLCQSCYFVTTTLDEAEGLGLTGDDKTRFVVEMIVEDAP